MNGASCSRIHITVILFQVLTHNLATSLGIQKAEEELDNYCTETSMSFKDYTLFLKTHVFDKLQVSTSYHGHKYFTPHIFSTG